MTRRRIGKATIYIEATDRETADRRWIYEVKVIVDGKAVYQGEQHSQPGGLIVYEIDGKPNDHPQKLVGLDSVAAFDEIARAVIATQSYCDDDELEDTSFLGRHAAERARIIDEATQEALIDVGQYVVKRR